jgi:phosphoglycolate phosphatase-like HAD superfamily hydrolase
VLFDIDGTLLSAGGISRAALRSALGQTFGVQGAVASYDYSGKTDPQIVRELMTGEGLPKASIAARMGECLARYQMALAKNLRAEDVTAKPGVVELLDALGRERGVTLGLLTGNLEACARLKLGPLGLNPRFSFGAFGSDSEDRYALPRIAVGRAYRVTGISFEGKAVVIVGDSIHDVRCGRSLDVRSVAVASGRTSMEVLGQESPDALLPDFAQTRAAKEAILGDP